ncbi:MAG: hypothetical protein EOO58_01385 [Hymenobacter sp.]|nr:MAG: hypothetical protein EOO58_01385 [Hymenobacter sp.]
MKNVFLCLGLLITLLITAFISDSWVEFAVDNSLSVNLPALPKTIVRDTVEPDGFAAHLRLSVTYDMFGRYDVTRDDLNHESDDYLTSKGRKEWYSNGPIVEEAVNKAALLKKSSFNINKIDGMDYVYDLPESESNQHTIKYMRHLLVGKVGYVFSFTPKDGLNTPCEEQKKHFFNSIRLKR